MERKVVLLVEDDAVLRSLLKETFIDEFEVLEASDYSGAVNQAIKHIDLALIDYSLPGKNGFEVLKMLREGKPSLPAILMTAYSTENLAIKAVKAGITDYVKKPFYFLQIKIRAMEILGAKKSVGYSQKAANRDEAIIDYIVTYLNDNYREDFTRDKLARMVAMDRFTLSNIFNAKIGRSIPSYVNGVRIEKAAELLLNPDLKIIEIAHLVGFKNVEHFNRLFKKTYNISPGEFRNRPIPSDLQIGD